MILLFTILFHLCSYIGWGLITQRFFLKNKSEFTYTQHSIFGIFTILIAAFFLRFFVSLSPVVSFLVLTIGLLRFVYQLWASGKFKKQYWSGLSVFLVLLITFHSRVTEHLHDAGFYHWPIIKWWVEDRLTLGLGNLHGNFGFNSTAFPLSALSFGFDSTMTSAFLVNSVIAILFFLRVFEVLKNGQSKSSAWFCFFLLFLFFLPEKLGGAKKVLFDGLGTTNTDTPAALFCVWAFLEGLVYVEEKSYKSIDLIFVLSILATTTKLSHLFIVLLPMYLLLASKPHKNLRFYLYVGVFGVLWLLIGFFHSGCWLYPSAVTCFPEVEWSVSRDMALDSHLWVKSWARSPGESHSVVLANWDWFYPWLVRIFKDPFFKNLIYLIPLSVFFFFKLKTKLLKTDYAVLTIGVAALVFWFIQAPDFRFAYGFWISLPVWFVARSLNGKKIWAPQKITGLFLIGLLWSKHTDVHLHNWLNQSVFPNPPKVEWQTFKTKNNVDINKPNEGYNCWDTPRPCGALGEPVNGPQQLEISENGFYSMISRVRDEKTP